MLVWYKLISSDGCEVDIELLPSVVFPYQEIAIVAAKNKFRNYRVEKAGGENV